MKRGQERPRCGDAAMRRCGGDAVTMRRSESGERTKRGEARRSTAQGVPLTAAKRGQARPNTASGAAHRTQHTHGRGSSGDSSDVHSSGCCAAARER